LKRGTSEEEKAGKSTTPSLEKKGVSPQGLTCFLLVFDYKGFELSWTEMDRHQGRVMTTIETHVFLVLATFYDTLTPNRHKLS